MIQKIDLKDRIAILTEGTWWSHAREKKGIIMNQIQNGNFIAEVRKQQNMTQRELAEKIGVSDKTISKWETGKSMPELGYLQQLCEI